MKNEIVLPDDYPVYFDYFYVCDGEIVISDVQGTVKDLKNDLQCKEVKNCNLFERGLI